MALGWWCYFGRWWKLYEVEELSWLEEIGNWGNILEGSLTLFFLSLFPLLCFLATIR
jgi:hypothetical protein